MTVEQIPTFEIWAAVILVFALSLMIGLMVLIYRAQVRITRRRG